MAKRESKKSLFKRDPVVQARLARIAISARRCPAEPAETFFEALNTMMLLKELGNGGQEGLFLLGLKLLQFGQRLGRVNAGEDRLALVHAGGLRKQLFIPFTQW